MQRNKNTLTLPWIHFLYWCWWYKHGCSQHVFMKPLRKTSFLYIQHSIKITQLFRCIAIYPRMYILYITFMYIFFQFVYSLSIIWTECFQPVKNLNLTAILLEMFKNNKTRSSTQVNFVFWHTDVSTSWQRCPVGYTMNLWKKDILKLIHLAYI